MVWEIEGCSNRHKGADLVLVTVVRQLRSPTSNHVSQWRRDLAVARIALDTQLGRVQRSATEAMWKSVGQALSRR
jgi:hypothetical protein